MIPVAKPWLGEEEIQAVRRPLQSGWVTQGPEVLAFEQEFAAFVGARHACAVSNCTVALHLALMAVGVKAGDRVITVSHSYIATANSVRYRDAIPVFVDIQPSTFNIDPTRVERVLTPQTKAILCVHQMGMPCDLKALLELAQRHNLPLIEDAACAIGSKIRWANGWERIGKPHGDIACFSFHPRKLLTTGDGGMITTSNSEWDRKFRLWRQHSMDVPDTARHTAQQVIFESYPELGFNYRMTDIQAAVGREQLKRLPEVIANRRRQVQRYRELLSDIDGVVLPAELASTQSNWQSFCVRLPDRFVQREVMQAMADAGVATRRGIMCAHREPAYRQEPWSCGSGPDRCPCPNGRCEHLIESERAQDHCILLPLFHHMTETQQEQVSRALHAICG